MERTLNNLKMFNIIIFKSYHKEPSQRLNYFKYHLYIYIYHVYVNHILIYAIHILILVHFTYPIALCNLSIFNRAKSNSCLTFQTCVSHIGFLQRKCLCSSIASLTDCSKVNDLPTLWKWNSFLYTFICLRQNYRQPKATGYSPGKFGKR